MSRALAPWRMLFVLALGLFTWVFVRNAWVVDDAYITFRTVDCDPSAEFGPNR